MSGDAPTFSAKLPAAPRVRGPAGLASLLGRREILPTLLLVPKRLLATADGEAPVGGDFDTDVVS